MFSQGSLARETHHADRKDDLFEDTGIFWLAGEKLQPSFRRDQNLEVTNIKSAGRY